MKVQPFENFGLIITPESEWEEAFLTCLEEPLGKIVSWEKIPDSEFPRLIICKYEE